jgi:hypothetical protein
MNKLTFPCLGLGLCLCLGLLIAPLGKAAQLSREEIMARAAVTELWQPVPESVVPGKQGSAPGDATVLFDGSGMDAWQNKSGEAAGWRIEGDAMVVVPGSGDLFSRELFGDVQLHIEWRAPAVVVGDSQERGNSGVFLMDRYEVQVLDSVDNPTYSNGQAASVYKQHIPLVNASLGPGQWQAYDIIFSAPVFSAIGHLAHAATITVLHNGVLVQNHVVIQGPTEFIGKPQYTAHGKAPIRLQDHSNPVSFRNIWVREL